MAQPRARATLTGVTGVTRPSAVAAGPSVYLPPQRLGGAPFQGSYLQRASGIAASPRGASQPAILSTATNEGNQLHYHQSAASRTSSAAGLEGRGNAVKPVDRVVALNRGIGFAQPQPQYQPQSSQWQSVVSLPVSASIPRKSQQEAREAAMQKRADDYFVELARKSDDWTRWFNQINTTKLQILKGAVIVVHRRLRTPAPESCAMDGETTYQRICKKVPSNNGREIPLERIASFIFDVVRLGNFNVVEFVVGFIYLERLLQARTVRFNNHSWQAVLVTTMIIADKMWEDTPMKKKDFQKILVENRKVDILSLDEMAYMEWRLWFAEDGLNCSLGVEEKEFRDHCEALASAGDEDHVVLPEYCQSYMQDHKWKPPVVFSVKRAGSEVPAPGVAASRTAVPRPEQRKCPTSSRKTIAVPGATGKRGISPTLSISLSCQETLSSGGVRAASQQTRSIADDDRCPDRTQAERSEPLNKELGSQTRGRSGANFVQSFSTSGLSLAASRSGVQSSIRPTASAVVRREPAAPSREPVPLSPSLTSSQDLDRTEVDRRTPYTRPALSPLPRPCSGVSLSPTPEQGTQPRRFPNSMENTPRVGSVRMLAPPLSSRSPTDPIVKAEKVQSPIRANGLSARTGVDDRRTPQDNLPPAWRGLGHPPPQVTPCASMSPLGPQSQSRTRSSGGAPPPQMASVQARSLSLAGCRAVPANGMLGSGGVGSPLGHPALSSSRGFRCGA